jgi:peroxiredoxin
MSRRSFSEASLVLAILAVFTIWITWRAKTLETHLIRSQLVPQQGQPGPPFRLTTLDGHTVSSEELRGKGKLVVSFWASWCGPCREELPALATFYRNTHKADAGYEIVAINEDAARGEAQRAAAQMKLPFAVLLDPSGATLAAYGVQGIPALFVLDEKGTVIDAQVGYRMGLEIILARKLGYNNYNPWMDAYGSPRH